jgi:hypothetical protein
MPTPPHGEQPQAPERAIAGRGRTVASDDDPTTALDHRQSGRRRGRAYPRTSSGHRGFPPAATASKESPVPWSDKVTVEALIEALEGCDPNAEVCIAQQPAWPFEYAIDPTNAVVEIELDDTPVAHLGEGAQLGHLPVRHELGW